MAEEIAKSSGIGGWVKAGITSLFGIVSGAVLMYLTPLLNSAVKPPEPVANFGFQAQGLTVTFQTRSTNATNGWWDFGDGSALEPYSPRQDTIAHTYAKPATYMVKLSLTNLFNEKSERSITINLDGAGAPAPVIEQFEAIPLSPNMVAPAIFRVVAKVKNADTLVWAFDGTHPIEVSRETGGTQERWVTINDPGYYTFHLVAVGGKQTVEKASSTQFVSTPQSGAPAPMATVKVTYPEAVLVERKENMHFNVTLAWNPDCTDTLCPVVAERQAFWGWRIVKADISGSVKDALLRGAPSITVSEDKKRLIVTGEMVRPSGGVQPLALPKFTVPIRVTLEKRSATAPKGFELPMCINVPGQTKIPLPALSGNWQATKRQVSLNLKEGDRAVWSGTDMPSNRQVQLKGRPVCVSATVQDNQIVLTVTDAHTAMPPKAH